jgi:hypothetical protein
MPTPYTGQTIRVTVSNLTAADGTALASPTVVIAVTDPLGAVTTPTVTQAGATYYAEFAGAVVGRHRVRATATSGTGTWKAEGQVQVYDFAT